MNNKIKNVISLVAGLLIGFTFVASGTGKLFGDMETPAQAMAFINAMLPEALLTPLIMDFIYKILVPVIFPWAELLLGLALIAGLMPRLAALLTLPMVAAFIATNIWTISSGEYSQCASCFGIWEKIFGYLTPYQSLGIDIVLGLLALCVIFLHPGRFFSNRWPVSLLTGRSSPVPQKEPTTLILPPAADKHSMAIDSVDSLLVFLRRNAWAAAGYILGITGIVLILITASNSAAPVNKNLQPASPASSVIENITVTDLTLSSGLINFATNNDEVVDIIVYDNSGRIIGLFSDPGPVRNHSIKADTLSSASTYYFQLLYGDATGGKRLSEKHSFTTMEPPPAVFNVSISKVTDSAAWITWETDRPTTTEVIFGEEGTSARTTITDNVSSTLHESVIQPLDGKKVYAFVIMARDAYGHQLIAEYEGILSLKTGTQLTQRAPDITLTTITGNTLELSKYRGKAVLLTFWSMTCPSCQKKMPLLQKAFERVDASKLAIITVHGPGREAAVKSYCLSQGLTLPVLLDLQGDAGSLYNVMQLPSTFILDQAGVIRSTDPEFATQGELDKLLNPYLSR